MIYNYNNDNGTFYEFSEYFESLPVERLSQIGDILEVIALEDGTDPYRGPYMNVKLDPTSKRERDEQKGGLHKKILRLTIGGTTHDFPIDMSKKDGVVTMQFGNKKSTTSLLAFLVALGMVTLIEEVSPDDRIIGV